MSMIEQLPPHQIIVPRFDQIGVSVYRPVAVEIGRALCAQSLDYETGEQLERAASSDQAWHDLDAATTNLATIALTKVASNYRKLSLVYDDYADAEMRRLAKPWQGQKKLRMIETLLTQADRARGIADDKLALRLISIGALRQSKQLWQNQSA